MKNAGHSLINKMVWPKSSQYLINSESFHVLCSICHLFVILNGPCLIVAVAANLLEKCCFDHKNFFNFYFQLFV